MVAHQLGDVVQAWDAIRSTWHWGTVSAVRVTSSGPALYRVSDPHGYGWYPPKLVQA